MCSISNFLHAYCTSHCDCKSNFFELVWLTKRYGIWVKIHMKLCKKIENYFNKYQQFFWWNQIFTFFLFAISLLTTNRNEFSYILFETITFTSLFSVSLKKSEKKTSFFVRKMNSTTYMYLRKHGNNAHIAIYKWKYISFHFDFYKIKKIEIEISKLNFQYPFISQWWFVKLIEEGGNEAGVIFEKQYVHKKLLS